MMERQIGRLQRLVDDLLDVARISRGKLELHKRTIDLGRVVQQAAESVHVIAEARQHEMKIIVPVYAVPVEADAGRLEQVLTNLLDNAIKYTPPGGRIALDLQAEHVEAVIRVSDNGAGIPQHRIADIFNLFAQAHPALEQTEAGLGLGLALVKGHRSSAWRSGPGKESRTGKGQ